MLLWPTRVHNPNGISVGSAVFAGLTVTIVTDRQTDRQTDKSWSLKVKIETNELDSTFLTF